MIPLQLPRILTSRTRRHMLVLTISQLVSSTAAGPSRDSFVSSSKVNEMREDLEYTPEDIKAVEEGVKHSC